MDISNFPYFQIQYKPTVIVGCIFWMRIEIYEGQLRKTTKRDNCELDLWLVVLACIDICVYPHIGTTAWTLHLRIQ